MRSQGRRQTEASPKHLQPELVDASRTGARNLPVLWGSHVTDRDSPLGVVPGIERLESELKARLLGNPEVLEHSRVPVVNAGRPQNAAAGSAQEARRGLPEGVRVEPLGKGGLETGRVRITDKIGPVCAKGVVEASDVGGRDGHGESALERDDAVHL